MNNPTFTIVCTIISIIITFLFSYLAFWRNKKKDSKDEGQNMGVIISELGYIKSSTDDIKRENRETNAKIGGLTERVTRCEESLKQAHHRIDEVKGVSKS